MINHQRKQIIALAQPRIQFIAQGTARVKSTQANGRLATRVGIDSSKGDVILKIAIQLLQNVQTVTAKDGANGIAFGRSTRTLKYLQLSQTILIACKPSRRTPDKSIRGFKPHPRTSLIGRHEISPQTTTGSMSGTPLTGFRTPHISQRAIGPFKRNSPRCIILKLSKTFPKGLGILQYLLPIKAHITELRTLTTWFPHRYHGFQAALGVSLRR